MTTPTNTEFQVSPNSDFSNPIIHYAGAYTTHYQNTSTLPKGIPLYARVRHASLETGYSAWGTTRMFQIVTMENQYISTYSIPNDTLNMNFTSSVVIGEHTYTCGVYQYTPWSSGKPFVMKLDDLGNVLWCKTTTHSTNNWNNSICGTDTDGIFTLGYGTISYINCMFLTKWGYDGNLIWQKVFYAPSAQYADGVACKIRNGYMYLLGYVSLQGDNTITKLYVYKVDLNYGAVVWGKKITYNKLTPKDLCILSDNRCYVLAYDVIEHYPILIKFDGDGNFDLAKRLNAGTMTKLISDDTNLYLGGMHDTHAGLIVLTQQLDVLFSKVFVISTNMDCVSSMIFDGGYLYLGINSNITNTDYTVESNVSISSKSDIAVLLLDKDTRQILNNVTFTNLNGIFAGYSICHKSSARIGIFGKVYQSDKWVGVALSIPENINLSQGAVLQNASWEIKISTIVENPVNLDTSNIVPGIETFDTCSSINQVSGVDLAYTKNKVLL